MTLSAGFSRTVINPDVGVGIEGYYVIRKADGVLDDLEINGLALALGSEKVLILSMDLCQIAQRSMILLRQAAAEATGLPLDHVFCHSTHTHTGPICIHDDPDPLVRDYFVKLQGWTAEAAKAAVADLKPARMGWGVTNCDLSHSRRIRMKDGSIRTNPGLNNPDSVCEVGEMDHRLNVLRFDREGGDTVVLVNYGMHPDSIGRNSVSADWPGFMRRTFERTIPGTKCLFLNGAEGDVGAAPAFAQPGWFNDTFWDFDDVIRGYGHSRWYGRYMAGAILQIYDKVNYCEPDRMTAMERPIRVKANVPAPEEIPEAHRIHELHIAGRDSELGLEGMMVTTVVAEAERMVKLENGPETFEMPLSGIALGDIAIVGIPGEPFTGIGVGLKDTKDWTLVLPVCNANGSEGYFPMQEHYDEGGYETRSSMFKAGTAEYIIEEGKKLLSDMKQG
ncbi:MAG: hypothetical protein IJU18_01400 [Oscillospiraceae bacterium]|nr:hypothetical protein [Oscillospiraceae bacterium]